MKSRKNKLILLASPRARKGPNSPLLRLVRDHADVLSKYHVHSTEGTAVRLLGTGFFDKRDVKKYPAGEDGGIAQLAALVARGECHAAIVLLNPRDHSSDSAENRAFKRVCIHLQVPLITTYVAALRWLQYEAPAASRRRTRSIRPWKPSNWRNPYKTNEKGSADLAVQQRTLALIAHDNKKLAMIEFVQENGSMLSQHTRILTTGTTGWVHDRIVRLVVGVGVC